MKTGTIAGIAPAGGYQSQNGYIYTFTISIQCPEGMVTGEIGSKSQTYPLGVGSPISFDATQTEHGVKIKKVNPQYPQGGSQGQPPQQAPPPYTPPSQVPPPQRDVQDDIRWAQAVNVVFGLYGTGVVKALDIQARHSEIYTLLKNRQFAPWMGVQGQSFNEFADQADAQDFPPSTDANDY